jgi:hypothetical protein
MNAAAELTRLLAEWRRLTELAWQAILDEHWPELARHQREKALLRPRIDNALERIRAARPAPQTNGDAVVAPFRAAASELIALERRNGDLLRAKCRSKREELQAVNQTIRNLQGVRRAYGSLNAHLWQSYS